MADRFFRISACNLRMVLSSCWRQLRRKSYNDFLSSANISRTIFWKVNVSLSKSIAPVISHGFYRNKLSSAIIFGMSIPFFHTEEEKPVDVVNETMKQALICVHKGDLETADEYLHSILQILKDQLDGTEITEREYLGKRAHVYCIMANVGLLNGDHEAAEGLFVETMRDCISAGIEQNDPIIVEISLKLAHIYAKKGDLRKAEEGFRFCITRQEEKLNPTNERRAIDDEDRMNDMALLGMACDYFAKYLHKQGRNREALVHNERALGLATELYTEFHRNVVNLINDRSVLLSASGNLKDAEVQMNRAIAICEQEPDRLLVHLPALYCNLGFLLLRTGGQLDRAKEMCSRSRKLLKNMAKEEVDNDIEAQLDKCFLLCEKEAKKETPQS